jgi:predicted nucleic acid-binding protein
MIVLDTNIVSEPMKLHSNPAVTAWLDRQVADTLYLTATSLSELLVGIEILPAGKRRKGLNAALEDLLTRLFGPRILPFDQQAAKTYATLVTQTRTAGHAISVGDGQIAAIAATHGYAVATRDTIPFTAAGVPVINPWQDDS